MHRKATYSADTGLRDQEELFASAAALAGFFSKLFLPPLESEGYLSFSDTTEGSFWATLR